MADYSIDLSTISLAQFEQTLLSVELLPSRRVLADHITAVARKLTERGIEDLSALKKLLAAKRRYPELAADLGVDAEFLTVLNREVNSYVSKPVPLAKLGCLHASELDALESLAVRSTKDLYERSAAKEARAVLVNEFGIDRDRLDHALKLANLVRINGVGPAFASFLLDAGVTDPRDFLGRDLEQMVVEYQRSVGDNAPKLRIEDLEYVQRYCRGLSSDIEW